ncbi:MAG: trypsin-like peptidase domain-containing protein [Verrucomicrobiota bacterium]
MPIASPSVTPWWFAVTIGVFGLTFGMGNDLPTEPSVCEGSLASEFYRWPVAVANQLEQSFFTDRQYDLEEKVVGASSGFVFEDPHLVATCFHSIGEGNRVGVICADGVERIPSHVYAWDESQDLALLRFREPLAFEALSAASSKPLVGESIAAMGNPGGEPNRFVVGVVSAPEREVWGSTYLPIAIPVEQGNSGGPVVNRGGQVLGLVALKDLRRPGLGYAVPIEQLREIASNPTPISMDRWCRETPVLQQDWTPDLDPNWRMRGSRISFRMKTGQRGFTNTCRATRQLDAEQPVSVVAEVISSSSIAGIAFGFADDGSHMVWAVNRNRGSLFKVPPSQSIGKIKIMAPEQLVGTHPVETTGAWSQLRVDHSANRIRCVLNGVTCYEGALPDGTDPSWGLHVSHGDSAHFRNVAMLPQSHRLESGDSSVEALLTRAHDLKRQAEELQQQVRTNQLESAKNQALAAMNSSAIGLFQTGILMAKATDPSLITEIYTQQLHEISQKVEDRLGRFCAEEIGPEIIATVLSETLFGELGMEVLAKTSVKSQGRLPEDPRGLLEEGRGGAIAMSALYLELARQHGLPNARATGNTGLIVCDSHNVGPPYEMIHTCNGEFIRTDHFPDSGCLFARVSESGSVRTQSDREFLLQWLELQKNQIPDSHWPGTIVPMLELLVTASPTAVGHQAELSLFNIYQGRTKTNRGTRLCDLLAIDPSAIDRDRMLRILEFMGFDLKQLLGMASESQKIDTNFEK